MSFATSPATDSPLSPSTPAPLATHRDPPPDAMHDVKADLPPFTPPVKRTRLASLDVFRGLTIAMMVLVNNGPGKPYKMLDHVEWHGWTPTDLVFPFFLFIVGVAIPFSLSKRGEVATRGELLGRIWIRALSLVMLGMTLRATYVAVPWENLPEHGFAFTKAFRWFGYLFAYVATFALLVPWRSKRIATWLPILITLVFIGFCVAMHFVRAHAIANGWPAKTFGGSAFNPDMMRIPGVLQRIGICYGVAATIALLAGWRTVLVAALALCTIYVVLMFKIPVAGHTLGSLTKEDNFSRTVDVAVFERWTVDADGKPVATQKHTYGEYPDNEGIVSTLPSIATSLCGILAGFWLRSPRTAVERCAGLLALAGPVIFLGVVLDHALMPINKNIWTPSFTVFCAGMAMLVLGTVFWLCDVQGRRLWAWPFTVMGMNAIAAFVASSMVPLIWNFFPYLPLRDGSKGTLSTYMQQHLNHTLATTSHWLYAHAPALGEVNINTPQNQSLAYALFFVAVIFVITWVLYVCRIFVKV